MGRPLERELTLASCQAATAPDPVMTLGSAIHSAAAAVTTSAGLGDDATCLLPGAPPRLIATDQTLSPKALGFLPLRCDRSSTVGKLTGKVCGKSRL